MIIGFIRGEHYCVALALLEDGSPTLSVLGCPNLSLERLLQSDPRRPDLVAAVTPPLELQTLPSADTTATATATSTIGKAIRITTSTVVTGTITLCICITVGTAIGATERVTLAERLLVFPPSAGSVFYAKTGAGAYARALGMSDTQGYEVQVSAVPTLDEYVVCESSEATHGSRDITRALAADVHLKYDYLRLDGQCKYCAVAAGSAHANLRLPPAGYREKVSQSQCIQYYTNISNNSMFMRVLADMGSCTGASLGM
jgi:3'-phosphoadenosine 5'-phosphosulfate (PAPS) 3'-phosphatase